MAKTLKLLRNSSIYTGRTAAEEALTQHLLADGQVAIASYKLNVDGQEQTFVMMGFRHHDKIQFVDTKKLEEDIAAVSAGIPSDFDALKVKLVSDNTVLSDTTNVKDALEKLAGLVGVVVIEPNDNSMEVSTDGGKTKLNVKIDTNEKILSVGENGLLTNLTINKVTEGLDENVKEVYRLMAGDNKIGEDITVYKDSSLKTVELDGQELVFTYILANGTESAVRVDVSNFLAESEFKDGLQVTNHEVSVKKDSDSEEFLTISADGVKISGIQDAINAKAKEITDYVDEIDKVAAAFGNDLNTRLLAITNTVETLAATTYGNGLTTSENVVSVKVKSDDTLLAVDENGLHVKDDFVIDCGTY